MKLFLLLLLGLPLFSNSQDITIGMEKKTHSSILNEDRAYDVYVPASFNNTIYAPQKYPVIYVLDGGSHFKGISGIVESLSSVGVLPEAIIIAISPKDKVKDLTPTAVKPGVYIDSLTAVTSGNSEDFTAFLQNELIPHIDSAYPTAPFRVLIGHSLGGLFVINTLFHHKELFNSYVAIDPALWWDDQKLAKDAEEIVKQQDFKGSTLHLAVTASKAMLPVSILIKTLQKYPANGLQLSTKEYLAEGHHSVPLIAEYNALRHIFSAYQPLSQDNETLYNASLSAKQIKTEIVAGYNKISTQMGYKILPSELMLNNIASAYSNAGKPAIAFELLEMNQKNYPKSSNVYDALGDYYYGMDHIPEAIVQYRKAIAIFYNPQTAEKLKKLQGEREH